MRHLAESCLADFKCTECQLKQNLARYNFAAGYIPHKFWVDFFPLFLQPSQHFAFWPVQLCC